MHSSKSRLLLIAPNLGVSRNRLLPLSLHILPHLGTRIRIPLDRAVLQCYKLGNRSARHAVLIRYVDEVLLQGLIVRHPVRDQRLQFLCLERIVLRYKVFLVSRSLIISRLLVGSLLRLTRGLRLGRLARRWRVTRRWCRRLSRRRPRCRCRARCWRRGRRWGWLVC